LRVAVEAAHELEREVIGAVNVRSLYMDLGVDVGYVEADRRRLRDLAAPQRLERSLDSINGGYHVDAVANLLFRQQNHWHGIRLLGYHRVQSLGSGSNPSLDISAGRLLRRHRLHSAQHS